MLNEYRRPGYGGVEIDSIKHLLRMIKIKNLIDVNKHSRQKKELEREVFGKQAEAAQKG